MKKPVLLALWVIIIGLIYLHTTDVFDQDLGRHLKIGEIIVATKEVPKTNLFSYTNPQEPVFNSHWGSQVIFYLVNLRLGVGGLILLSTVINTIAFGLVFFLAQRRAGLFLAGFLFIPFLFILLDRSWIRPEMFGNLFFAILLVSLFVKRVRKKLKWFFPLLSLFWINLHITAVFGVFVMAIVLFQDILENFQFPISNFQLTNKNRRVLGENVLIFLLTLAALLVNPYGADGVLSAFTVLNKYGYTIVENQSWLFLRDFGFPLVAHIFFGFFVLFSCFFMAFFTKRKPLLGEIVLLVAISILTLRFVRNETLFAYGAFLTSALTLAPLQKRIKHGTVLSFLLLVPATFIIINSHQQAGLPLGFGSVERYKPGVDFFLAHNFKGPIFNNFDIGGYLVFRLYPNEKVFVDNRPEAYPVAFFDTIYKPMQFYPEIFEQYTKQYGIETIIWGRRDITDWSNAFLVNIAKNPTWKPIYVDDALVIFSKSL